MSQRGLPTIVRDYPSKYGPLDLNCYGLEDGKGVELAECYGHIILEDERVYLKCSNVEASLKLNCLTTLTDFEGSGSTDLTPS